MITTDLVKEDLFNTFRNMVMDYNSRFVGKPVTEKLKTEINQLEDEIYDFVKNNNINLTNPINTYLVAYYWKE